MKSLIYIKLLKVGFTTSVSSVTVLYHCGFVNIYTQNQRDPIYIIIYNPINKINRSILNRDTVGFETMVYLLLFLIYCTPSACETIPRVNPFLYNQTYDLFVFMKDLLFHRLVIQSNFQTSSLKFISIETSNGIIGVLLSVELDRSKPFPTTIGSLSKTQN